MRFNLGDKELIKSCGPVLERLYKEHKKDYISLFFHEKDIEFDKFDLTPLIKTNILRKIRNKFRANVQVFPLSGKFIVTDFLISVHRTRKNKFYHRFLRRKDDVWAILAYESPYIAKRAQVKKGDFVLDLATGSGIIALFCADKAKKVIATDINQKAINYAKFNAILNNVEDKIEFRVGDLFKPVKGMRFDLIIWNGPTIPVPNLPDKYPFYCFGGPEGTQFTKKFIDQVFYYLKKNGRLQWIEASVGTEKEPLSLSYIKEKWRGKKVKVRYLIREKSDLFSTINYLTKSLLYKPLKPLKNMGTPLWIKTVTWKEHYGWIDYLKEKRFTHIYSSTIYICKAKKFKVIKVKQRESEFKHMNTLPLEWHFLTYHRILRLLKICENY